MMIMIIVIIIINIIMSMGLPNTPSRSKHAGGNHPTHTTPQGGKGGNHQSPHPNHTTPQGGGKQPTTTPHHGGGGTIGRGGGGGRPNRDHIYIHIHIPGYNSAHNINRETAVAAQPQKTLLGTWLRLRRRAYFALISHNFHTPTPGLPEARSIANSKSCLL